MRDGATEAGRGRAVWRKRAAELREKGAEVYLPVVDASVVVMEETVAAD